MNLVRGSAALWMLFLLPAGHLSAEAAPAPGYLDWHDGRQHRLAFAAAHNAVLRVHLDDALLGEKRGFNSENALARAGLPGRYSTWDQAFPTRLLPPGRTNSLSSKPPAEPRSKT